MKRTGKKLMAWALTLSMACSLCAPATMAAQAVTSPAPLVSTYSPYSDIKGHWAEEAIDRWSGYGVVQGDDNGFRPDGGMTRAEAATLFAKMFGLTKKGDISKYTDVPADAWFADSLALFAVVSSGVIMW